MIQSKSTPEFPSAGSSDSRESTPPSTPADISSPYPADLSSPYPAYLTSSPNPPPAYAPSTSIPTLHPPPSSSSLTSSPSPAPPPPSSLSAPHRSSPPNPSLSSSLDLTLPFRSPDSSPSRNPSPQPTSSPPPHLPLSRTVPWRKKLVLCLVGLPARGKCWAAGTQLRMLDGGLIRVEEVRGGERLMGDDGRVRTVTEGSVTSGRATLYDVVGERRMEGGSSMTVNAEHILVLLNAHQPHLSEADRTKDGPGLYPSWVVRWYEVSSDNQMQQRSMRFSCRREAEADLKHRCRCWRPLEWEVSVREYLKAPACIQRCVTMYRAGPVTFVNPRHTTLQQHLTAILAAVPTADQLAWAAWFLGLWLIDGVLSTDSHWELMARLHDYQQLFGESVAQVLNPLDKVGSSGAADASSTAQLLLEAYGLVRHRRVPAAWLFESIEVRRHILAGIVDGVGQWKSADDPSWGGTCYEVTSTSRQDLLDLRMLALSLGIKTSMPDKLALVLSDGERCNGWRMDFSARVAEVTQFCALSCKRVDAPNGVAECESRSFPFSIAVSQRGTYHGFSVHGGVNSRLLLEDFTVTHNVSSAQLPCAPHCTTTCSSSSPAP